MYPLQCYAGYPMPIKAGKFEILGVIATVSSATLESQLTLVDNAQAKVVGPTYEAAYEPRIIDFKANAGETGTIGGMFTEPMKTRGGLSAVKATNLVGGSVKVYVR